MTFAFPRAGNPPVSAARGGDRQPDADQPELLEHDALIDLAEDEAAQRVRDVLLAFDRDMVGLAAVKRRLGEIAALLIVSRARARFGLSASRPSLHMCFSGGPGTGKTTVALRMAEMLHALGYLRTSRVWPVTRDDLVGQFIGHTAPKTKEAIGRAAGGVLFIDEAYNLHRPENERDYGQETIEILLQEMESGRGSLVVIFAGYADRMETFLSSNPGLSSRVAHHIRFDDYHRDELVRIAELIVDRDQYVLTPEARLALESYVDLRIAMPRFANARSIRNALERCRLRQATRLADTPGPVSRTDLMTLTEADVRGSSVFGKAGDARVDS